MWTKKRIGSAEAGFDAWTRDAGRSDALVTEDRYEPRWVFTFGYEDESIVLSVRGKILFDSPEEAMLACDQAIERYGVRS